MVTVETPSGPVELTEQQYRPLALAARHLSNKEIAREMNLSPRTVEDHMRVARRKLGVATRAEAVRLVGETPGDTTRGPPRITPEDEDPPHRSASEQVFTFHDAQFAEPAPWTEDRFRLMPGWRPGGIGKPTRLMLIIGIAAATMVLLGSGLVVVDELTKMFAGG